MRIYYWIVLLSAILMLLLSGCFLFNAKYNVSGYVKDISGIGISHVIVSFSGSSSSVTTNSSGYWVKDELSGKVVVTPSKTGWTFSPSNIMVNGAKDDVNFTGGKVKVTFQDPNLEKLIRATINKATGTIYQLDLLSITSLKHNWPNVSEKISNLEGIQYCLNLTDLELDWNSITTITQLSSLTNLQILCLVDNPIRNISPLINLINLQRLDLGHTEIRDISPIQNLTNITSLNIGGNPIPTSNWAFLKNWTWLQGFGLGDMNLPNSDIKFLSNFTSLNWLNLCGNQISDISPLQNLTNLQWLYLDHNIITDIQPLVNNSGIGSGDKVVISYNYLDLTPGSTDMNNINILINRGVNVVYQPQNATSSQYLYPSKIHLNVQYLR